MRSAFVLGTLNPTSSSGQTTVAHNQPFTLTGSGFGTYSTTLLLDDHGQAGIGVVDSQWTGGSALAVSDQYVSSNIQNRATNFAPTGAAIGAPNPFVTSFLAGDHYGNVNGDAPWTVYVCRKVTLPAGQPCTIYVDYDERADPNSALNLGHGAGPNLKNFGWSAVGAGIQGDTWTFTFLPASFDTTTATYSCNLAQNGSVLEIGSNLLSTSGDPNPYNPANGWKHVGVEFCADSRLASAGSQGFIQRTVNGTDLFVGSIVNNHGFYTGKRTDSGSGTTRFLTIGVGAFQNDYGDSTTTPTAINNWTYLGNIRILQSGPGVTGHVARVMFKRVSDGKLALSYVSSWSDTQITGTFWQGMFSVGDVVTPTVYTESGSVITLPNVTVAAPGVFDFFISQTGNDANAGTLAAPWAITAINTKQSLYAGKRVGIIAGTYDVSSMMNPTNHTPVLNINGGPNSTTPTYIASCDASGIYTPRAATLDAKGTSGFFGGGNTNISSIMGQGAGPNQGAKWGNWTIDGLRFTGYSAWAVHVGSFDGTGGNVPNATIQNCEFTGQNAQSSTVVNGVNLASIELYAYTNCTVQNNYIHDNTGWTDAVHFTGVYTWGQGAGGSSGLLYQFNTHVNSGGIYGKSDAGNINPQWGATIQNNYFDLTTKTPAGGLAMGISGFCNAGTNGHTASTFRNNVIVACQGMDTTNQQTPNSDFWRNAFFCYNNTWVVANTQGGLPFLGFRFFEGSSGLTGIFSFYNNLCFDNTHTVGNYGYVDSNVDGFAVLDYNIYGTGNTFTTRPSGGTEQSTLTTQTFATWKTATGGDVHSSTNATNPFTNNGVHALQYQVTAGVAFQSGKVGGVSTGAAVNVGAWDGVVTQIGSVINGVPD